MKTELGDRGFSYLTDARLGQYINWARGELDDLALWPYRSTTQSGSAPLTVTDIGTIESVYESVVKKVLRPADRRDLLQFYADLALTGTPDFYYIDNGVVKTFPVGGTIDVRHYKIPPDLTGTDVPLAPTRFHQVIVDIATRMAYRDSDNHAAAEALQGQIDRDVWRMMESLLVGQVQGPQSAVQLVEGW